MLYKIIYFELYPHPEREKHGGQQVRFLLDIYFQNCEGGHRTGARTVTIKKRESF